MYGNFDITVDRLAHIPPLCLTLHTPCGVFYFSPLFFSEFYCMGARACRMLIGACNPTCFPMLYPTWGFRNMSVDEGIARCKHFLRQMAQPYEVHQNGTLLTVEQVAALERQRTGGAPKRARTAASAAASAAASHETADALPVMMSISRSSAKPTTT